MGDVAMTVPVIKNLLHQNPQLRVTVVSNALFQPLFEGLHRCVFYPAHLKLQHKGITGIVRLYKELKSLGPFQAVADLHNVLRSSLLRTLFQLGGVKNAFIDKGRKEKKLLTRKENKVCRPLTTTHERYAAVFRNLGFIVKLDTSGAVYGNAAIPAAARAFFLPGKPVIGIAPFAQYKEKMYPLDKMKTVVQHLAATNHLVLLFGGGTQEVSVLQQWEKEMDSVFNVAGSYSFREELAIISNLRAMVSMDSANMHLASLYNIPVISIWGATHTFAGFYGWGQSPRNIVEIDLYCRPCSVFGNKPCYRGDHACMQWIPGEAILERIRSIVP